MNTALSKPIKSPRSLSLIGVLALTLAGCSLAPAYTRPALPVPASQSSTPTISAAAGDATPADFHFTQDEEQLFAELSPHGELKLLVTSALGFNRDFRVAQLRVEEARAVRGVTRADRLPTVAAGIERNRQHFDNAAADERYGQNISIASLGVSDFELDFFGRVRSLSDAARHDYLATTYGQQAARSALIAEVAQAYLAERLAAAMLLDAQTVNDARLMLVKAAETQQRLGAISVDELAVQRVDVLDARQHVEDAVSEHATALHAVLLLTGYSDPLPAMTLEAMPVTASAMDTPAWLRNLPSQRLLDRFDIRQREETLKAGNANIGAARAAFFPSIRLSTGVGIQSEGLHTLFSGGSGAWLFNPQLNLPLFDGGRNQANLDLAHVHEQIAVAEYEKAIQAAFREMADALTRRQQAVDHVRVEAEQIALVQEKIRRLSFELDAGSVDRTAPLVSAIRVAQADATLRKSVNELQQSRVDIYRVLCGAEPSPSLPLAGTGVSP